MSTVELERGRVIEQFEEREGQERERNRYCHLFPAPWSKMWDGTGMAYCGAGHYFHAPTLYDGNESKCPECGKPACPVCLLMDSLNGSRL